MAELPTHPIVLVFPTTADHAATVYLLNDSDHTAIQVLFRVGTIYYSGVGKRRRRVQDLLPHSYLQLNIGDFWEPGPQSNIIDEVVWSNGTRQRELKIPSRLSVSLAELSATEISRSVEFLDPEPT